MHNPIMTHPALTGDIRYLLGQSALGELLVAENPQGICTIALGDAQAPLIDALKKQCPYARSADNTTPLGRHLDLLLRWLETPIFPLTLPLDIQGTGFQKQVWHQIGQIPPGHVLSYGELARQLGKPTASRAVASACAANCLALVIPCHRVIRQDGHPGGYRWGIQRKQALLKREAGLQGDRSGNPE